MYYIVNDIENLAQLNLLGVLQSITLSCTSISVTNIKMNDWSDYKQKQWSKMFTDNNVQHIEVEFNFYNFSLNNKNKLFGISDGDKSSIYQCLTSGSTLVTSNNLIKNCAESFQIEVLYFTEFISHFIKDKMIINTYNEIQII